MTGDLNSLLRRVAQHDVDAFAEFNDLTSSNVFGLVARVLRDPGYSEETTQEVYLQVWRNASNYDPAKGSALAWLRRWPIGARWTASASSRQRPSANPATEAPALIGPPTSLPTRQYFARNAAKLPSVSTH